MIQSPWFPTCDSELNLAVHMNVTLRSNACDRVNLSLWGKAESPSYSFLPDFALFPLDKAKEINIAWRQIQEKAARLLKVAPHTPLC